MGVGVFGWFRFIMCLTSDLLKLMTMHVACAHTAFSRLYAAMLSVLFSLFCLFRGKKRNVLRNRIDNAQFDQEQLVSPVEGDDGCERV